METRDLALECVRGAIERFQIGAGAEEATGAAADDQRANLFVIFRPDDRVEHLARQFLVERIGGLGPVERNTRNAIGEFVGYCSVFGHDGEPPLFYSILGLRSLAIID